MKLYGKESPHLDLTRLFFKEIVKINKRDAIIAALIANLNLNPEKILSLLIDNFDFGNNIVSWTTEYKKPFCRLHYVYKIDPKLGDIIKNYIGARKSGFVFITRNNKRLTRSRLLYSFDKASEKLGLKFCPSLVRLALPEGWFRISEEITADIERKK